MGCMLWFKWVRVLVLDKKVLNVGHGEAGCVLGIVACNVNARVFGTCSISVDGVVLLWCGE